MQIPTNMDFTGDMRLRVYAFEEMVSINALQSTFGQSMSISSRNASPTCVQDKLTSEEIERKADMQIANVLKIGKVARQLAYNMIASKHSEKVGNEKMSDEQMHNEKMHVEKMHVEKMHNEKMHDEKVHDEQDIYEAAYTMQSLSKGL